MISGIVENFWCMLEPIPYLWHCLRWWWNRILAGSIAGLSILALDDSNRRRTLALYLLARVAQVHACILNSKFAKLFEIVETSFLIYSLIFCFTLQCAYNSAKSKNKFHLWGSHWRHGDSLLFALACAQVIQSSYWFLLLDVYFIDLN